MSAADALNSATGAQAREQLYRCCACERWVGYMLGERPFRDDAHVIKSAREFWSMLGPDEWLEAFRGHPKIGDVESLRKKYANTTTWTQQEQAGVQGVDETVLHELREMNQAYEQKFGFIFIICATGRTAEEMLAALKARIGNTRDGEMKIAAAEQAKITALRLEKLT